MSNNVIDSIPVCPHCDEYVTTVPRFVRDYTPEQVADWHSAARCCEPTEPIR